MVDGAGVVVGSLRPQPARRRRVISNPINMIRYFRIS
jgi:hypothetical protein